MVPETRTIKLSSVIFSQDFYPRKKHDPELAKKYLSNLEEIEARGNYISIAADGTLLDGRHRHIAYTKRHEGNLDVEIPVFWYDIAEPKEKFSLAIELNSTHGYQLAEEDKRRCAMDLYGKYRCDLGDIAKMVSVRKEKVLEWTKSIRDEEERRENETIFDMWMECYTSEQIAALLQNKYTRQGIDAKIERLLQNEFPGTKFAKLSNFTLETDDKGEEQPYEYGWKRPLYNVWSFAKKTNSVGHFGNSEQRIVENMLYLYTNPYDIVFDPFAGGGSTLDVCSRRLRRCWISDRKPIVERENEIRKHDLVTDGIPSLRWSDVTLTYLDPPYWRQAANQYSKDPTDLANMSLEQFTDTLSKIVKDISRKQSRGVIALLIQPTQWSADEHRFTDHVTDLVQAVGNKRLILENRVSCPYSTEQYNAQQVQHAKDNKMLLVLTRELIIWRIAQ